MDMDESLSTKLWLEKKEKGLTSSTIEQGRYALEKFSFAKKDRQLIEKCLKKHTINQEIFLASLWGLLINRLSTSDYVSYGVASMISSRSNILKLQSTPITVQSSITNKTTIKQLLRKTQEQLQNEDTKPNATPIRYLLVFKAKTINKKEPSHRIDSINYPLVLYVDKENLSHFSFFYDPLVFSKESIQSIYSHLLLLLNDAWENTNQIVTKLNLLTDNEKIKILSEWSSPTYDFHLPHLTNCAHVIFSEQAKHYPNNIAINHNDVNVSYAELDAVSTLLAQQLIAKGVKPADRVCVFMERTPTWIMAMLAILKSGAIYVPINPKFPDERIEYVLTDCAPKIILVNDIDKLPHEFRARSILINHAWNALNIEILATKPPLPDTNLEQIAYIIYTSGTTGAPKGVMIKHKSLVNLIVWYQGCFEVDKDDHSSQFASQGFDPHLCEIIPFLGSGASVHIVDDQIKLTPTLFFSWLSQHKITICDLPTAYAQILLSLNWPEDISLRTMKIGGETITRYPTQVFSFDIWNGYGPTETTVESTYYKFYSAYAEPRAPHIRIAPPIGKPIAHCKAYVLDNYSQPVPIGIAGELLIGGACVSAGYLNRDDLTSTKFISNPFNNDPSDILYRTGDLVCWLPDGNLEFIGRIDNQVKIRGYRIELGDIENILSQYPDVNETVVIMKEAVNKEKSLIAYVVPDLDRSRYLYQERCLLSTNKNTFMEAVTEDISKNGVALSGVTETIPVGHPIQLHLKLPGFNQAKLFSALLIWQRDNRCGLVFDVSDEDKKSIEMSIDHYISTRNVMELVLSTSAKRSLRKALKNKVPEYMVPSTFVTLMQFPLTFSGKVDVKALPPPQEYEQILHKEYIAPKTETERKLTALWTELLHRENISMTDNFFDLGGSSLSAADLSVRILQQFNISIPAKILFDLSYIPILAEYIDSRGTHYSTQSLIQDEIERDRILPDNLIPTKHLTSHLKKPKNILLTGAGGFLGVFILNDLIKHTDANIYCIIRKGEFETAAKRLLITIQKYALANELSLSNRRIVAIAGDISYDNFGMPLELYNSLLTKIDLIYHCGAQVNIMASYNKLRGSNVQGTLEIIKFATQGVDKPIHYVSTLSSAYMKDSNDSLAEVFPDENYEEIFGGYAISKWVSERLLTEAKNRGLPVSIYRSGYISGETKTGTTNVNDALFMLMKGCIQLGYAPDMEEKITILPVDFVSYAITKISLLYPDAMAVYHIDHPTGIMWSDLVAWINEYGYHVKIISIREWQEKLVNITHDNALFPFLPFYLALPEKHKSLNVCVENATEALEKMHIAYPAIDDKLLSIYFDYLCEINFLPPPGQQKTTDTAKDNVKVE